MNHRVYDDNSLIITLTESSNRHEGQWIVLRYGEVEAWRVFGNCYCGEGCVILPSTVFDWSTRVTDGRTDGRWHIAGYSIYAVAR